MSAQPVPRPRRFAIEMPECEVDTLVEAADEPTLDRAQTRIGHAYEAPSPQARAVLLFANARAYQGRRAAAPRLGLPNEKHAIELPAHRPPQPAASDSARPEPRALFRYGLAGLVLALVAAVSIGVAALHPSEPLASDTTARARGPR